jgi:hypothetical protein
VILSLVLLLVSRPAADCGYDRAAMLALDSERFDQDMAGGWRAVEMAGCEGEAADLIRDWRAAHRSEDPILFWHEGQLRATIGQSEAAVALFERARKPQAPDESWAAYVDGSIAFLRDDRAGLEVARGRLAALPPPANFNPVITGPDGKPILGSDGKPLLRHWPPNLKVLDRLRRCWGQPYKIAYICPASTAATGGKRE